MSLDRTKVWLTAWVVILLMGTPAMSQGVRDMALFAPPDLSTYGGGVRPREGLFFTFDWLWWGINAPQPTSIGNPSLGPVTVWIAPFLSFDEVNSADTSFMQYQFTEGTRFEFGSILEHHGWFFSAFRLQPQEQTLIVREAHVLFQDTINTGSIGFLQGYVDDNQAFLVNGQPPRLPTIFNYLKAHNRIEPWGVELNYLHRTHPGHHGFQFELFAGARYLAFDESFRVKGLDAPPAPPRLGTGTTTPPVPTPPAAGVPTTGGDDNTGGDGYDVIGRPNGVPLAPLPPPINILADSYWNTSVDNRIVGPQVGSRIFYQRGRWCFSTEGRFFAGFNSQSFRQDGLLASKAVPPGGTGRPLLMEPYTFTHWAHFSEFSPGAELRVEASIHLTRAISIGAGWTGLYLANIGRAASVINYQVPVMGFDFSNRNQDVFINGLNIKLIINR